MSGRSLRLPTGYEVLVHGPGPHDVAIWTDAKVELMKATKEQRAEMSGAIMRFASGAQLPARMHRLEDAWYPSDRARRRVRLQALTPVDVCAYGYSCTVAERPTFFITGVERRDASDMGEREFWSAAGDEALRVAKWVMVDGGSHAVSAAR